MLRLYCSCALRKRQVSELQPFELATTMLMANLAALPLVEGDASLLSGITPIICLTFLQGLLSIITAKNRKLRRFICGTPAAIIKDGKLDVGKADELMLSVDDIIKILRSGGNSDISKIKYVVLETGGDVSLVESSDDIITTLIENGKYVKQNISEETPSVQELSDMLFSRGFKSEKEVFWAFLYKGKTIFIGREKDDENV